MDHPLMHSRRASSSVFNFKAAAAASVKAREEEGEDYEDSAEEEEEEDEEDEEGEELEVEESYPKKKRMNLGGGSGKKGLTTVAGGGGGEVALAPLPLACQVAKCEADLTSSKRYHQRHKVCEYHSKAQVVIVAGQRQRFCQQCSRFHDLSEFDDSKRSCRRRLAGHNERRRKHFSQFRGEGAAAGRRVSTTQIKKNQCRQIDERGKPEMAMSKSHQDFHIR